MLIGGILLGLLLGLLAGGRIQNLAEIRLRWTWLLVIAVVVRFGTEAALAAHIGIVETLRLPLLTGAFVALLIALWVNRSYPGLSLAFLGVLTNTLVIVANNGYMPIWEPALLASGLTEADVDRAFHVVVDADGSDFLGRLLILGDVVPAPVPFIRNVYSLGDLFLGMGLAFFLFAGVVRVPTPAEEEEDAELRRRLAAEREGAAYPSGLAPGLQRSAALQRPTVLGAGRQRLAAPSASVAGGESTVGTTQPIPTAPALPVPRLSPEVLARLRRHPYVRLALNGSFGALWAGQLISLFGDRVHQVAIAAIVFVVTDSPIAVAMVFVAATLPNLLFGPIAGTLVDRWDHREVLVVSDILRAAVVVTMPIAASINIYLVYPLAFLLTTISIFFRPARVAILPRLVREDELLTANSALWVGETMADVIGFPLAGLFVALVADAVSVAFWFDGATYLASALLLSTLIPRPMPKEETPVAAGEPAPTGFRSELVAGWRFLRNEPVLLANTLQAVVAQLTIGVLIGQTAVFAEHVFGSQGFDWRAVYGFIEGSQGAGNLIGGFVIGLIGVRLAKGRMIIAGYTVLGLLTTLMALSGSLGVVLAIAFGIGVANMVFIIPSQTLFQERTPVSLLGRVVGFRFSLVFGAMTLSIGVGGVLAEFVGVTSVIAAFGLVTAAAGIAGWFVPAVREA
ncbi:MAG TPA: MFS transporter [Candidatus Limnocylindrales bacterium]|jgi:MFS transporter, DHA3 family, macrolide efflux protein|nr:MFS transporter [Candidatus Limnocylindrales bacterium]